MGPLAFRWKEDRLVRSDGCGTTQSGIIVEINTVGGMHEPSVKLLLTRVGGAVRMHES